MLARNARLASAVLAIVAVFAGFTTNKLDNQIVGILEELLKVLVKSNVTLAT